MTELRFEEAMARLEEVVRRLEAGDLSLEESLQIFEEGIGLSRWCLRKLEESEKKVEILLRNPEGEWEAQPWDFERQLPELENAKRNANDQ
ncbi:MAG: exodeoxyribonuclease VII small subunit [Nitrospinae bacterium]|nr:exodeoxyribonuclease VII small subunit [Nitrospinota bacterium]